MMYIYIETTYKIPCHFNKMEKKKSPKLRNPEETQRPKTVLRAKNNNGANTYAWAAVNQSFKCCTICEKRNPHSAQALRVLSPISRLSRVRVSTQFVLLKVYSESFQ